MRPRAPSRPLRGGVVAVRPHWAHKAAAANAADTCMGNPQLGDETCPDGAPVADGMHHGRCQYCQDLFNWWRRERHAGTRRYEEDRTEALFALLDTLRGRRLRLALWVLMQCGYEFDMAHYGPRCIDRRRAGMGYGLQSDRHWTEAAE